ncbi:RNA polymerase II C-terminal domain phosphatase-like 3 isoform X2 [Asparagus officinalis]|uniref:RNA polymerase II C-terminal domain phosphatase-like 3 isoform X1 n=1 Tax=Asparagus officinalis TaxID=4686 RepID=UPI00098E7EAD|nr:RNA polymerase II C-terminal domain phosphatase-like 3 isoform X1 [Asparagus officinalis]XP_020246903.1 RNA polymerase II C-terminal domain phosphatase-like 3 isoform X2 [Asparagus officinalis]
MAKHRNEEGSNSDDSSGSVKEITADDLKKKDARAPSSRSRVWASDLMGFPVHRNYNQDLYSFAWAQAVQNKPLGLDVKNEVDHDDDENNENEGEVEKEEGELEEGEIEFGSEVVNVEDSTNVESNGEKNEKDDEVEEIDEFDNQFGMILEELETITVEEAESSFQEVCSRLQKSFASLKQMFLQGHGPVLDVIVQQAFVGIQTIYSAFNSGHLKKLDQNKELLLRLLIHIKNQYSVFLTPEQVKEIDVRVHTLASEAVLSTGKTTSFPNGSANVGERPEILAEKRKADQRGIDKASSANLEQPNASRSRVDFSPLLNLHGDYDEDSLPSPTRDNAPPLPVLKPIGFGSGTAFNSHLVAPRNVQTENATLHPYVTDALKAVSSYQEKYGKNSILESTRLPSPTPSEDGNGGNDDINGEVSSSSGSHNARTVLPSTAANGMAPVNSSDGFQMQPVYSSAGPQMAQVRTIGQVGSEANPAVKASAKSRDPRLRFMKSETSVVPKNGFAAGPVNSLKHKSDDELVLDEHSLKRQRKDSMSSRDVKVTGSQSGATKDRNLVGTEVGYEMGLDADNNKLTVSSVPSTSISTTGPIVSLPSLLKGIAANPQMLVQLLRMEQQKIAAGQAQEKPDGQAVNGLSSATSSSSGIGQNPSVKSQMPPQTKSTNNNMAKIRMKPRDPRRVLHSNMAQRTENSGSATSNVHSIKDQLLHRKQGDQAQKLAVPLQSASLTDISQQFTKNLQNLADMVSKSQSKTSDDLTKPKNVPELCSQTDTKPAANPWGDVDHLLDGYDDKQKAAIQKERARRIEEQNKMFAARKLCLVLDLDHTLLNSAKFVEIDPIHEEILRKKEEQDRQTQERHLFRLQHMGMWTKLRPGIWTFLEKASQLYELHVYTMGNKLYATEMAKLLDPKGNLFAGRVLSRGDDGDPFDGDDRVPKSKDLDGVLGMESAVLIIDDSLRVWPHNKHNLIVVERYTYFPSSRRQFGLIGPSLLEIDHDERPEDGTLASSLAVIERIHEIFFSHSCLTEVDVRNILGAEQRKILAGCKIVFSRIFPVGEANPHLHPLWQTAEQFGAECTNQIDEQVTHVVANSLGTDKVNWALSTGRFVVHPGWVEASALLYRRANEQDFAVKV